MVTFKVAHACWFSFTDTVYNTCLASKSMSLLQLPPELLVQIFNEVGSSYFRSDLSRLTICRRWSRFALTACFRSLYVNNKTLRRLQSSPYMEAGLDLIQESTEVLILELVGFEDLYSSQSAQHNISGATNVPHATRGTVKRRIWGAELNNILLRLSSIMKQSPRLRTLRIHVCPGSHSYSRGFLGSQEHFFEPTIHGCAPYRNLTSLELDPTWCLFQPQPKPSTRRRTACLHAHRHVSNHAAPFTRAHAQHLRECAQDPTA